MKKTIALLIAIILSFSLLMACNKEEQNIPKENEEKLSVTEENVAELFKPSLEAYLYLSGSTFYELERDENGNIISYLDSNIKDHFKYPISDCFKIASDITVEEIKNKVYTYTYKPLYPEHLDRYFVEENGDLYVGIGDFNIGEDLFDLNSIELYKNEGDKYYITVDVYFKYTEGKDEYSFVGGNFPWVFTTTLKNGILYIEDVNEHGDEKEPTNNEDERSYIYDVFKFSDYYIEREKNIEISKSGAKIERLASQEDFKEPITFDFNGQTVTLKPTYTDIDFAELSYEKVYKFRNGTITFSTADGDISFDRTGKIVNSGKVTTEEEDNTFIKYNRSNQRGNNLFVEQSGRQGAYIQKIYNKNGELLNDEEFNNIGYVYNGLAAVERGHKVGFIDENGNTVLEPTISYDNISYLPKGKESNFIAFINNDAFILPIEGKVAIITIER